MVFVDGMIVNLTLAQLASHLHASRTELEWAVNAYALSFAAVMLGGGTITDTLRGAQPTLRGSSCPQPAIRRRAPLIEGPILQRNSSAWLRANALNGRAGLCNRRMKLSVAYFTSTH